MLKEPAEPENTQRQKKKKDVQTGGEGSEERG